MDDVTVSVQQDVTIMSAKKKCVNLKYRLKYFMLPKLK